jgi:hypothetical protein
VWQATAVPGDRISVDPPRPLTEWEKRVVARLAPDAEEAAIDAIRVTDHCGCGCSSIGFSDVAHFPAAEAEAVDNDGTPIWVMLFADRDQRVLATLDVLRADSQPIHKLPPANDLAVKATSAWTGSAPASA